MNAGTAAHVPGSPSIRDLASLHNGTLEGNEQFHEARLNFKLREKVEIIEEYYAPNKKAAVLVVQRAYRLLRFWRIKFGRYKIRMFTDGSIDDIELSSVLREARSVEGLTSPILRNHAQHELVLRLNYLICDMLNSCYVGAYNATKCREMVEHARDELQKSRDTARDAAIDSSLSWYLLGLPLGAVFTYLIAQFFWRFPDILKLNSDLSQQLSICLTVGGMGAIVSVMTRITRRGSVEVDTAQGRSLTVVAGGFRTVVGAVLGAVLFILISGGLVPIEVPDGKAVQLLFFAGLAFLAGFSERWAQDTVVHSVPQLGSRDRAARQDTARGDSGTNS